jgi:hypothetical protein
MLERGGWGAVSFEEDVPHAPHGTLVDSGIVRVSVADLRGDSIETIVKTRRDLVERWKAAYEAVPEIIRASAPARC